MTEATIKDAPNQSLPGGTVPNTRKLAATFKGSFILSKGCT